MYVIYLKIKIMSREYIPDIKGSLRTDSGSEFKGIFHKWLYDENILHRVAEPNRHQQLANAEILNKLRGRLLNGYMNAKEEATGKVYKQWTDVINIIRTDLNELRERQDGNPQTDIIVPPTDNKPKFKVNDIVILNQKNLVMHLEKSNQQIISEPAIIGLTLLILEK